MTFRRGDIVLVPFPFTDLSAAKQRPVLALMPPDRFDDFVGLPITSRSPAEHGLPLDAGDLASGSLPRRSWVRTDRPTCLDSSLAIRVVAQASEATTTEAVRRLCALLAKVD